MIFTDDDLKRLKDKLNDNSLGQRIMMEGYDIRTLLARLEAAESCINNPHHFSHHYPENHCKGCIAIQEWRKAAGIK